MFRYIIDWYYAINSGVLFKIWHAYCEIIVKT